VVQVNENYLKLKAGYLFPEIAKRVKIYSQLNKSAEIIKLGIGDVTEPLPKACIEAMGKALDDMGTQDGFRGYGPEQGYSWLREKISEHDFISRGCQISPEEIFVSDGSKCDSSNILDILGKNNSIAVTDPVYPVYVDSNVMTGRTGDSLENGTYQGLTYLAINEGNNFLPKLPQKKVDILYLCFPNNPTGATITKEELKKWVDYALQNKSLILFDAAYEAFIQDNDIFFADELVIQTAHMPGASRINQVETISKFQKCSEEILEVNNSIKPSICGVQYVASYGSKVGDSSIHAIKTNKYKLKFEFIER